MNVTERVMMPRYGVGNEATCSAIINEYTVHNYNLHFRWIHRPWWIMLNSLFYFILSLFLYFATHKLY